MASLVNTKTFEASARMYGIFVPRTREEGSDKAPGSFFVRIPSYSELPPQWREKVVSATELLFSSLEKDNVSRKWATGKSEHDMLVYRSPKGLDLRDALAGVLKNIPSVLKELGLLDGSSPESERFEKSFARLLEDYDIALEKPESTPLREGSTSDREARIIASDLLSRVALIFQAPFIVPGVDNPEVNALSVLHDKLFSAEFGPFLGSCRDLGLVQTHIFGASPYPIRGGDLFTYKEGKDSSGIEIKIGWDGLLNSRPAMDAIIDVLLGGRVLGDSLFAPAELKKSFTGKSGYTGDPNGIRSLSGETLFIKIPEALKEKEAREGRGPVQNFISALHAVLSPWLNMGVRGDMDIKSEDKLSPGVRKLVEEARKTIAEKSDVYKAAALREQEERQGRQEKTEKGMDLTPRIVPYPGKSQLYMLFSADSNSSAVRNAVGEFVSLQEGMNPPEWRENSRYKYAYTYITADREATAAPLSTLEGRLITAKKLSAFVKEKTGVDIGAVMPESLNLTLRVGGLAGKKGETYALVEVPASTDRDIRKSAKKGELVISDESAFLADAKKILTDMTSDEDEPCEIDGAGELVPISSDDRKTVFGVNLTAIAGERSILEEAVNAVETFVGTMVVAPLKERYESVNTGITVKFTKDERARKREKELRENIKEWRGWIASLDEEVPQLAGPEPGF